MVSMDNDKNTVISLREIGEGKISIKNIEDSAINKLRKTQSQPSELEDLDMDEDDSFDFGLGDLEGDLEGETEDETEEGDGSTRGRTVVVNRGDDHKIAPELRKIRHNWQIDDESFDLTIKNRSRVVSLLGSSDVKPRSADDKKKPISIVALAFRPGSGKMASIGVGKRKTPPGTPGVVVQVLSHFGKQHSDTDEFSLQNLLLNFLIDSNTARLNRSGKTRKR